MNLNIFNQINMILSFELTMPNVGSWDGKWTGKENPHFRCRTISKTEAEKLFNGKEKLDFHYSWSDGWGANVQVKQICSHEKRKLEKITKGFCGYEWMIDSIIKHQKILTS